MVMDEKKPRLLIKNGTVDLICAYKHYGLEEKFPGSDNCSSSFAAWGGLRNFMPDPRIGLTAPNIIGSAWNIWKDSFYVQESLS